MTREIKVLHILFELRASGAEVRIKNASRFWKEKGLVLHLLSTSKVTGDFTKNLSDEGIIIHHFPFANSFFFYTKVITLIRSNQFDVVHIHTEQNALTYVILCRIARVPVIIRSISGFFLFEGFTKFNRIIRRWLVRKLGVIQVSISDAVRQNELIRLKNPTLLINNWYDDLHFYPPSTQERRDTRKKFGLTANEKVIVSVGNCAPVKNHESIINALLLMKESGLKLTYWHVGEEEVERKEQKLVKELELNDMVKFWGRQDDVRPFLWAADIFVMPSFHEGFGLAVFEAIGCGIPVVLARTPGLDQWSSCFPEIIYSDTSSSSVAQGLTLALTNKNKEHDQEFLRKCFGIKQGAEEYFALYKKQLGNYVR